MPHITKQIEAELATSGQKLDRIIRKLNNGSFLGIASFFSRRTKEKIEGALVCFSHNTKFHLSLLSCISSQVSHDSLLSDQAKFSQLDGLNKIIADGA
jgi:hypothetical protein